MRILRLLYLLAIPVLLTNSLFLRNLEYEEAVEEEIVYGFPPPNTTRGIMAQVAACMTDTCNGEACICCGYRMYLETFIWKMPYCAALYDGNCPFNDMGVLEVQATLDVDQCAPDLQEGE